MLERYLRNRDTIFAGSYANCLIGLSGSCPEPKSPIDGVWNSKLVKRRGFLISYSLGKRMTK